MPPRPAEAPLACAVYQIKDESPECQDYKQAGKKHQCRQHLLNKIYL
jgi:hypothetical protein